MVAAPAAVLITVNVGAVVVVGVDHPAHAQGGVVFLIGGPGLHQNAVQRLFHRLIVAEGQPQPLAGNHGGVQRGVIAQAAESVEVRSGQIVAGPVFIVAGVGHGHHPLPAPWIMAHAHGRRPFGRVCMSKSKIWRNQGIK